MGYWRDAAVRIAGTAVLLCQLRFFFDWNYATKGRHLDYDHRYFPDITTSAGAPVQIVSGGPDTYWNPIKESYLKMINSATDTIYIQTPYFIPGDSVRDALRIAALSGLDVRIMIPNRPDHPFVYWAGLSFLGQLLDSGVRAYTYDNGFLHARRSWWTKWPRLSGAQTGICEASVSTLRRMRLFMIRLLREG